MHDGRRFVCLLYASMRMYASISREHDTCQYQRVYPPPPLIRFKLLCGCVFAIDLRGCIGTLRQRAVSVCVESAVLVSLRMSIMCVVFEFAAYNTFRSSSGLCFGQDY